MKLGEWRGAVVEPAAGGSPPSADDWRSVDLPGSPAAFAGADCVAYRTTFPDPREGDDTRALLTLRGLYARGRVWINGEFVGDHGTYFEPARFVFEPEPRNEVVVECRAPDDRFGGVHDTDLVPEEAAVPAVWWDATVEGLPPVAPVEMTVEPRLTEEGARFEASLSVDATADAEETITFSLRPQGFRGGGTMERETVSVLAGERRTVDHTVSVREPELWYPRGHGPQHRYALVAKLGGREVTVETGLRTVEYGEDGFRINGVTVPLRGVNVLPSPDPFADVERAAEANANLVRAHAHVPPRTFNRACDEAGLLVWQDLPLTGEGGYDIARGKELAGLLDDRLRNHPSTGAFGVHDDPREVFPGAVGGGRTGRARVRWRAWRAGYNASPDESVAEAFPDDVPTFPVAGPLGIDPDAVSLYPGWDYGSASDADWLLRRYPETCRVVGEFGAGALADGEVDAAAGFDAGKHDARVSGGVEASQAYQAEVVGTVAEALRRHDVEAMAAFALRDTDAAGMGVLARDGAPKAAFDALRTAYEPVVPVLDGRPKGSTGTTLLNDGPDPVSGTLSWEAGDSSGAAEVSADPLERVDGPTVSVPKGADDVVLEFTWGGRTVRNRYER